MSESDWGRHTKQRTGCRTKRAGYLEAHWILQEAKIENPLKVRPKRFFQNFRNNSFVFEFFKSFRSVCRSLLLLLLDFQYYYYISWEKRGLSQEENVAGERWLK